MYFSAFPQVLFFNQIFLFTICSSRVTPFEGDYVLLYNTDPNAMDFSTKGIFDPDFMMERILFFGGKLPLAAVPIQLNLENLQAFYRSRSISTFGSHFVLVDAGSLTNLLQILEMVAKVQQTANTGIQKL